MVYTSASLLEAAKNAVPQADLITLRIHRKKSKSFYAQDAEFEGAGSYIDAGFMIEVLYNGHISYGSSQNMTNRGAAEAALKAFNAAKTKHFGAKKQALQRPKFSTIFSKHATT